MDLEFVNFLRGVCSAFIFFACHLSAVTKGVYQGRIILLQTNKNTHPP